MKKTIKVNLALVLGATAAVPAMAQSSVTLYGLLDTGVSYQNSQTGLGSTTGGHSNLKLASGVWYGSRFGFKGAEDLGNGYRAIFQLESGFNLDTGAAQFANAMFSRQAWVGLSSVRLGSLSAGRQYTPYYTLISPYGPTTWLTAFTGAHPGDLDGMDTTYRANNSLVYMSPKLYGVTFGASYSFAGVPGSVHLGATWAAALQYSAGPIGLAIGVTRLYNSTPGGGAYGADSTTTTGGETGVSAVTDGYQTAQAQQRFAVSGAYQFSSAFDASFTYTNVQYIPGSGSRYRQTAIFNTGGVVLHWKASTAWDISGGYSYTRATKANGISNAAQYQQVSLSQQYSLSKRTSLYVLEAYQRAHGNTLGTNGAGNIIAATATIGDGYQTAPSATPTQAVGVVGIIHRF